MHLSRHLVLAVTIALGSVPGALAAEDPRDERIARLEKAVAQLTRRLASVKEELHQRSGLTAEEREMIASLGARVDKLDDSALLSLGETLSRFDIGGYGEIHANFGEGSSGDQFDIHRLVLTFGYDFAEWIRLSSEIELEHAFVSDDDGELSIEQLFVDFLLSDALNVRAGRILTPMGIINQKHEPPTFNGVERPAFAKYIIPTTWSSDGIGIWGSLTSSLQYQAYLVGGLDGSKFNDKDGIRGGRIKERPSLHDPAVTGRLDWHPFAERAAAHGQALRLGVSAYAGGIDNGNQGHDPDISGDVVIVSADGEYSIGSFDFRGAVAHETIDGARDIGNGAAEEIFGWYLEGAVHAMPDAWKNGRLEQADAVLFVRYDDYDTQHRMPSGVPRNPDGDRSEWTVGVNLYLTPNFVVKADYQIRDSAGKDPGDAFNLGLGWSF